MSRKFREPDLLKEDLRAHVDLVPFMQRYMELTKRGERWVGFCPFHEDKNTPSFAVSPDRIYEPTQSRGAMGCWACDARGGDLYWFVQKYHNATFYEAIGIIAEIVGFDLTPWYRTLTEEEQFREDLYNCMDEIAEIFTNQLLAGKKLAYFERRGINAETLAKYRVGYCPSMAFLVANVDAEVLDFIEPNRGNRHSLFADRIVYAQWTTTGHVWGWYSRQPDNRPDHVPKYLGPSKEAKLFEGTDRVYGLPQARKRLRGAKSPLLIVEGFNDTLAADQAELAAVAACGSNLSGKQIETLQAHAVRKAIVVFDPDRGGQDGMFQIASRAHKIQGIALQFADVPLEPEEFLTKNGINPFREFLDNAVGALEYIVSRHADRDTSTATKKRDFLDHLRPYFLPYSRRSLDRVFGIQTMSRIIDLPAETLEDFLDEGDTPLTNLPGEMILLAELAQNPASWVLLSEVSERDFSLRRYRETYRLMRELYEQGAQVNVELLLMHGTNTRASVEVLETISKLPTTSRKTPELFARNVRDMTIRREAIDFATKLQHQVSDLKAPVEETIARAVEGMTNSMTSITERTTFSSFEAVAAAVSDLEERVKGETGIAGLNLGPDWSLITRKMNGLRPGRHHVIAAWSGAKKSITLTNWLWNLCIRRSYGTQFIDDVEYPIDGPECAGLFVSMEMTKQENVDRLAAIDSGVPHWNIEHGRFSSEEEFERVVASYDRISESKITWMEGAQTFPEISLRARLLQAQGMLDFIFLDYIQLVDLSTYSDKKSVTEQYNALSWDIKNLAARLSVPIVSVAQLNRGSHARDVPTIEDMGSSYKIAQDAHFVYILVPTEKGVMGSLDKGRSAGDGYFNLSFDKNEETSDLRIRETGEQSRRSGR